SWSDAGRGSTSVRLLLSPSSARRSIAFFGGHIAGAGLGCTEKSVSVAGTPVVGGVSATDERVRQVPRSRASAHARPGGGRSAPRSGWAEGTAEAGPGGRPAHD